MLSSTNHREDALGAESSTICIQELSVYGQDGVLARPQGYAVEALSHDHGASHVISARLVAFLSSRNVDAIRGSARAGDCFIKLDWTFPGSSYPKFTTRHLLDVDDTASDVSFSGGLDWAHRILVASQHLQPPGNYPSQACPLEPRFCNRPDWLVQPPLRYPFDGDLTFEFAELPEDDDEDCVSLCSDPTSSTVTLNSSARYSALGMDQASEPPIWGLCREDSCADGHLANDDLLVDDDMNKQHEALRLQRMEAEAMLDRNGDAGGLLAVMASASGSIGNWDCLGRPIF